MGIAFVCFTPVQQTFFAHDKFVYARMIPVYLADMDKLRERDNDIYADILSGN